jgi:hypothetical protein
MNKRNDHRNDPVYFAEFIDSHGGHPCYDDADGVPYVDSDHCPLCDIASRQWTLHIRPH